MKLKHVVDLVNAVKTFEDYHLVRIGMHSSMDNRLEKCQALSDPQEVGRRFNAMKLTDLYRLSQAFIDIATFSEFLKDLDDGMLE